MESDASGLELRLSRVRRQLDELVERRLNRPLTDSEQAEMEALNRLEEHLLQTRDSRPH